MGNEALEMNVRLEALKVGSTRLEYHHKAARQGGLPRDPIVLLHPWRGCWQFWNSTLRALPEYDCYAPDLYSLGAGGNTEFASPAGLAEATNALIDARRLQRCIVIGNSMGGLAAQVLAVRLRERVSTLILVGTGASGIQRRVADLYAVLRRSSDRRVVREMITALLAREPESASEMDAFVDALMTADKEFVVATVAKALELDVRPHLGSISARTLIVRGELDTLRTREHARELLAGIPNSEAVEIAGAGHSPQVDSSPLFTKVLRQFLERGLVGGSATSVPESGMQ